MNCYQKFYTNQIHSSSLLCQLATMWKSQVLCDAIIRSGNVITKAHRVVLVAACPMLQSMENAAVGSHLEVRLASDIKQGSIHTFLQYLYEGFMMLTEENCKDVEKIARLLQVDSVIKCCADFYKCLSTKTGNTDLNDPYKYTFHDMVEFRHVRSSDLQKMNQDRMTKRGPDFPRPSSPGGKRQRMNRPGSPPSETVTIDDTVSMSNSYNSSIPDPWERVPRLGTPPMARQNVASKPGVVEVVEDSLELIQTEPPNASGNRPNERRSSQKSVSIAVSSQIKSNTDLQIVNVSDSSTRSRPPDPSSSVNTSQSSITVSPLTLLSEMSTPVLSTAPSILPTVSSPRTSEVFHVSTPQQPTPHVSRPPVTSLPFAAGSAAQSGTQYPPLTVQRSQSQTQGSSSKNESFERVTTSDTYEKGAEKISARPNISNDKAPDISIVKIESDDENTGLDMYVDMPDESEAKLQKRLEQQDDGSDTEHDTLDWSREHMSSEDNGHMNSEQNAWFMGQQQYKGYPELGVLEHSQAIGMGSKSSQASYPVVKDKSSGNSISSHKNVSGLDFSISEYKARHSSVDNTTPKSHDLSGDPLQYQCQFCSEQFDNKQTLHTHHHENHKCNFLFVCDSCGKGFNSRLGYDNHIKLNHGSVEDCFTCDVCLKRFPTQNTLTIHQRVHSEYRPFICTECGRSYKHKKDLKHHRCAL